jgi:NTE family protein
VARISDDFRLTSLPGGFSQDVIRQPGLDNRAHGRNKREAVMRRWSGTTLAVVLLVCQSPALAGTAGPSPRIGLVLSGGGARGIAHIGVLQWLEEHRIPVHCVAGTSMGGLVGGFYAMGYSSAEILDLVRTFDWKEALGSGPSYPDMSFRRKEDRRQYQVDVEIGLKAGASLSPGLVSPHFIGLFFDRVTLPYWSLTSFDDLPIPFRCLATDFIKAQPVVLRDGPLGSALRATMSIPGVLPPAQRDGKTLVDGGLLNNIPTNVMKAELKPDLVIAVDTGTRLGDLKKIATLGGVLDQSIVVMTIDSDRRNLAMADIVIAPDLGGISTLDFSSFEPVVGIGYEAAAVKRLVLEKFTVDEAAWQQLLAQRSARRRTSAPTPAAIAVSGVPRPARDEIAKRFERFRGQSTDTGNLEKSLTRLVGEGRYQSIGYALEPADTPGTAALRLNFNEKTYAPPTLKPGLEIESSDVNDVHFTIGGRLTFFDVGRWGSEWRNDFNLGFNTLAGSEYYFPLGGWSGMFVAPRATWTRGRQNVFESDQRVAEYKVNRIGGGIDLGRSGRLDEVRVGYVLNRFDAQVATGDPLLPSIRGNESYAKVQYSLDSTDSPGLPHRGARFSTEGRWYTSTPGAEGDLKQAEARLWVFIPVSAKGTVITAGSIGTSFGSTAPPGQQFTLGGPFRLGAFERDRFRGSNYTLGQLGYLRQISQLPPLLGGKLDLVIWGDLGGAFEEFRETKHRAVFSGGVVMETRFGPVSFTGSWGDGGHGKIWFSLGRLF